MSRVHGLLVLLLATTLTACATTGATPAPYPGGHAGVAAPAPAAPGNPAPATPPKGSGPKGPPPVASTSTGVGYNVAGTALSLRGAPYKNGGADPGGFDCSGFIRYVFAQNGISVPRTVADLFRAGKQVTADRLKPGDLVFFSTVSPGASHVGVAIGGDEFVHAPSGAGQVRVERMSAAYWVSRFVGARRLL